MIYCNVTAFAISTGLAVWSGVRGYPWVSAACAAAAAWNLGYILVQLVPG